MATLQITMRKALAADWTSNNPTLNEGEIGYETDTKFHKIGDGTTAWTSLAYYHGPPWLQAIDGGAPDSTYDGEPSGTNYGVMVTAP